MTNHAPLVGSLAPDFDLPCTKAEGGNRERAALADYRGRWLVLLFYPRDFSLVCPTELSGLSMHLPEFRARGCEVLGISCDTLETHERWLHTPRAQGGLAGLGFRLASDHDGTAAQAYGVYLPFQHVALRGLFIIDPNGVLQYQVVHNMSVGRRADEVLRVLAALQTGGLCAENWSLAGAPVDPTESLGKGSVISQYRIEEKIGSGTFGAVFRAIDLTLERAVALKVLKPVGREPLGRALAEARAAAALSHINICTIFGVDDSEGVPIIAMEYLHGRPLSGLLKTGALAPEHAQDVARQIAAGMSAAHARGIVHGDLKPDNVFITEDRVAKILDFGLARRDQRAIDPNATVTLSSGTGSLSGTPRYMAPEVARGGGPGAPADVFAFGVVLYEMLTGRRALEGNDILQVFNALWELDAERLASEVPEPFGAVVRQALLEEPSQRISMAEILERLATWRGAEALRI
jgi:alkyl hydroperoxide reductase subunit AhpC